MLGTFPLSFGLKVIAGLQNSPWDFWKLQNRPYPHLPPPCSALAAVHRQRRPSAPSRPFRPLIRRALAPTRRGRPPPPPCCLALELPGRATRAAKSRSARAAATSPSRWRARCSGRRPLLASARALQISQKPIPTALFSSPRSHTAERRRRPRLNAGELTPPRSRHHKPAPPQ